jgi:hypothetical protein
LDENRTIAASDNTLRRINVIGFPHKET